MSKKFDVLQLLKENSARQIFNNSNRLLQVSFFYKNLMITISGNPIMYINDLEEIFIEKKEEIIKVIELPMQLLEDYYEDKSRLNDTEDKHIFCSCVYSLVRLNILKNDNENGLLAIFY